jgi:hypothetical protein
MNRSGSIEVIDKNGWRKTFPLEKGLVHIGSDQRNDIVLDAQHGLGVAPRQLQLIAMPGEGLGYRAINLGSTELAWGDAPERVLKPHSVVDITDETRVQLGDFQLVIRLDSAAGGVAAQPVAPGRPLAQVGTGPSSPEPMEVGRQSELIGLSLSLPHTVLHPEQPLQGIVTVHNRGNMPGVQFRLEIEGLEADAYEIGPGPVLFPNVEKGVALTLHHPRRPEPRAGTHSIQIHATAPEAYPGERASIRQELEILPYYSHTVRMVKVF